MTWKMAGGQLSLQGMNMESVLENVVSMLKNINKIMNSSFL